MIVSLVDWPAEATSPVNDGHSSRKGTRQEDVSCCQKHGLV